MGDIAGAQPDTVKHAIRTNRVVNPLNPMYDSLDGERLKPPMTPNILNGDPKIWTCPAGRDAGYQRQWFPRPC